MYTEDEIRYFDDLFAGKKHLDQFKDGRNFGKKTIMAEGAKRGLIISSNEDYQKVPVEKLVYWVSGVCPDVEYEGDTAKHVSYALASFSRFQTTSKDFFNSTIKHNSGISLTIQGAQLTRNAELHTEYVHTDSGRQTYIEIQMSNSQFAELLTSMNIGEGVPVTLVRTKEDGRIMYKPPFQETIEQRADRMLDTERDKTVEALKKCVEKINEIIDGKTVKKEQKAELARLLDYIVEISKNGFQFAESQFQRGVEKDIQRIKSEIDATLALMNNNLQIRGVQTDFAKSLDVNPEPE